MKKIFIALVLSALIGGSCKKDGEIYDSNPLPPSLEGKWLARKMVETITEGGIEVQKETRINFTHKDYVVFNIDSTAVHSYEGYNLQHTVYSISAGTLKFTAANDPDDVTEFAIIAWTHSELSISRKIVDIIKNVRYITTIEVFFERPQIN